MKAVPVAILLALAGAPAAFAASWKTATFGHVQEDDAVPRVAIARDGHSLLTWRRGDGRLVASFGDARGRFGAPAVIARRPRDYAVAPGAVAYEASDGVHVAVSDGRRFRDRRVATSTGSSINGVVIAADPLGGWVVAERQYPRRGSGQPYRVRAVSLDADGRPAGDIQDLGPGQFGIDARPTQALAVLPDGRALFVFQREPVGQGIEPTPVVLAVRPHAGAFGEPVSIGDGLTGARVTVAGDRAALTVTQTTSCGDAGCAGQPRAVPLTRDLTPQPPQGPDLAKPNRAFGPWATPSTLVFQLKTGVQPFSREAPVRAVALPGGPLQTLTSERATEPVALPIGSQSTLTVWATRRALGAALAGADGRFTKTAAPAGSPPQPYHFNSTNRDARSAGRYAIVTWVRGNIVRVSLRRF